MASLSLTLAHSLKQAEEYRGVNMLQMPKKTNRKNQSTIHAQGGTRDTMRYYKAWLTSKQAAGDLWRSSETPAIAMDAQRIHQTVHLWITSRECIALCKYCMYGLCTYCVVFTWQLFSKINCWGFFFSPYSSTCIWRSCCKNVAYLSTKSTKSSPSNLLL